jgi:threonylcarbamoyladenosine tRNA methylthiotransferase MtaB
MKVAFYTLGCKVNQYETDLMMKKFVENQYEIVDFDKSSDIYIINSCSVTNLSTRKTRQALSKAKKNGGIVVLCGCYAQEIKDRCISLQNVDIIVGNEEKDDIVEIISNFLKNYNKSRNVKNTNLVVKVSDISNVKKYKSKDLLTKGINIRESVKIEDGCNNFCSYCIIPYVRGRVRSKFSKIWRRRNSISWNRNCFLWKRFR